MSGVHWLTIVYNHTWKYGPVLLVVLGWIFGLFLKIQFLNQIFAKNFSKYYQNHKIDDLVLSFRTISALNSQSSIHNFFTIIRHPVYRKPVFSIIGIFSSKHESFRTFFYNENIQSCG
jgi:hypothetical protein